MKKKRDFINSLSAVAFGTTMLLAFSQSVYASDDSKKDQDQLVECYGVAKAGPTVPLMMTKAMCDKLPSTKQVPVNTSDYVQCYGVAAAGKNGCASKAGSCGGSTKVVAKAADAWVSLPQGICQNLQDAGVGSPRKS